MYQNGETENDDPRQLYSDDVREKKAIANASKNKVASRGVSFYSDMLTGKAKKEYTKAGELIITSPYDTITPLDEFKSYNTDKRVIALTELLKRHTKQEIGQAWGSRAALDGFIYRYGLGSQTHTRNSGETAPTSPKQKALSSKDIDEIFAYILSLHFSEMNLTGKEVIQKIQAISKIFFSGHEYHLTLTIKENIKNE
jgi:hypothetical protein